MTININPLESAGGGTSPPAAASAPARDGGFAAALSRARATRAQAAPAVSAGADAAIEETAPAEVLAQSAEASRAWESLQASGREVQFSENPGGGVSASVHRLSGERIAVLALNDLYTLIDQERGR